MPDCVAAARDYLQRGWRPVPAFGKRPLGERWADRSHDWAEFEGRNVGVVLGKRSSGLVDVDLDAPEALELADLYLPSTSAIFGRASKPRSHRLYVAPGAVYEKFVDPICDPSTTKATLLELRTDSAAGSPCQTIFPPSVHECGERVEWEGNEIPLQITDLAKFRRRCALLASAALILRYIDPILDTNWAYSWSPKLAKNILGGWPKIGRIIYNWLEKSNPFAPPRTLDPTASIEEIIEATENNLDWDTWVTFGLALYRTKGDAGWGLFNAFSQRYIGTPLHKLTRQRWSSFRKSPPREVGIGTLRHIQQEHPRIGESL